MMLLYRMVVHSFNSSTQHSGGRDLWVEGQSGPHRVQGQLEFQSETLSQPLPTKIHLLQSEWRWALRSPLPPSKPLLVSPLPHNKALTHGTLSPTIKLPSTEQSRQSSRIKRRGQDKPEDPKDKGTGKEKWTGGGTTYLQLERLGDTKDPSSPLHPLPPHWVVAYVHIDRHRRLKCLLNFPYWAMGIVGRVLAWTHKELGSILPSL